MEFILAFFWDIYMLIWKFHPPGINFSTEFLRVETYWEAKHPKNSSQ